MKLSYLLLLPFILFSLTSCGDDEDMATPDSELNGTWSAQTLEANATTRSSLSSGGQTIETVGNTDLMSTSMNYDITFGDETFTTEGSYDLDQTTTVTSNGVVVNSSNSETSYSNVEGQGSYRTSGNQITLNGSLFSLEVNGQEFGDVGSEEQVATYEISGDVMTFVQNQTTDTLIQGVMTTIVIESTSTFTRQ